MNFGVMLLSPIFLVRIFDIRAVGQYGEFILFATVIAGLIDFSISSNLIYFIPKYPDRERQSVTHTTLLILTTSAVGLVVVYFCRGLILARTHYDFILPLILYLLFAVNFEFFESYWLGKKRTDIVLYYSTGRVIVRTTALLISAYVSRDVMTVIRTLIVVEFVKCLFVFAMLRGVLTKRVERGLLREQLRFIVPLGSAVVLGLVNHQIANLFISIKLGVERLALYRIGGQQIPVMGIVRSSVMDVLFPEMAQIGDTERLHLWRRANVVFCFIVFPVYAVFFCYAHIFIEKLFTADYLAAVPLFRIYLTLMVIQSFEMGTPLRAINQNKYFIFGSVLGLSINIGLILLLFRPVGFMAPALSFIVAELAYDGIFGEQNPPFLSHLPAGALSVEKTLYHPLLRGARASLSRRGPVDRDRSRRPRGVVLDPVPRRVLLRDTAVQDRRGGASRGQAGEQMAGYESLDRQEVCAASRTLEAEFPANDMQPGALHRACRGETRNGFDVDESPRAPALRGVPAGYDDSRLPRLPRNVERRERKRDSEAARLEARFLAGPESREQSGARLFGRRAERLPLARREETANDLRFEPAPVDRLDIDADLASPRHGDERAIGGMGHVETDVVRAGRRGQKRLPPRTVRESDLRRLRSRAARENRPQNTPRRDETFSMKRNDEPSRALPLVARQDAVEGSKPMLVEIERRGPHAGLVCAELIRPPRGGGPRRFPAHRSTMLSGFPSGFFERGPELLGERLHIRFDEDILVRSGNHDDLEPFGRELAPERPGISLDFGGRLEESYDPWVNRGKCIVAPPFRAFRGYRRST